MRHLLFAEADSYPIAVLTKANALNRQDLMTHYLEPLNQRGIPSEQVIAFTLGYNDTGKAPVGFIKQYLEKLLPALDSLGTKLLYVCDGAYFKVLTKERKAEPHAGYALPCKIEGYEHMTVVLGVNYQALIYNPDLQGRMTLTLETLASTHLGTYQELGQDVIQYAEYPEGVEHIARFLEGLHAYDELECDIETFSLKFWEAGIGTVGFSWAEGEGGSFTVDYVARKEPVDGLYGYQQANPAVYRLLRTFFETYQGRIRWHNAGFDLRTLIYVLWMEGMRDTQGLLKGLDTMTRCFDDTKLITYLATNSTAGNKLSLKDQAHEFAGNYAQDDIKDIRRIPLPELLEYNLVDCLSTRYIFHKHYPTMVADQQEEIYENLMLPSVKTIIQIELTGMPLDQHYVAQARSALESEQTKHRAVFAGHSLVLRLEKLLQREEMEKANAKLKTKQHPLSHFSHIRFNPNSPNQLQRLLYEVMDLPVLDLTDTKQPATGAKTLNKLINHAQDPDVTAILQALIGYSKADKILTSFIPNFEEAIDKGDGVTWLHGNFNLGGTVSGRLSSTDPNLQQIPSGSAHAKIIKKCFRAPEGWLFTGADFNSLEDYISALTTKDPNKLKVYSGLKQYDITINGKTHRINEEDVVSYDGVELTGAELYEKLQNSQP